MTNYSDAARRLSDTVNLHITVNGFNASGKWVRATLAECHSDGALYDTKEDAIRHALMDESYYVYVCIPPDGMSPAQAERYLKFTRQLYDNGMRVRQSDGDRTALIPMKIEDHPR